MACGSTSCPEGGGLCCLAMKVATGNPNSPPVNSWLVQATVNSSWDDTYIAFLRHHTDDPGHFSILCLLPDLYSRCPCFNTWMGTCPYSRPRSWCQGRRARTEPRKCRRGTRPPELSHTPALSAVLYYT
jgi:hypothetical protein